MDNYDQLLAGLIDDSVDISAMRVRCLETHHIDFGAVYCLHTGKVIGEYSDDELDFAIQEEMTDDDEELFDALIVRCVASMRPSPALNKPDMQTLRQLCLNRPVDAMAYLVNRLYGNKYLLVNRGEDTFAPLHFRIRTHRSLTLLADVGFDFNPWLHWLLDLDSKLNLHEMSPPLFGFDEKTQAWAINAHGLNLIEVMTLCFDKSQDAQLLACFESWVFDELEAQNKLEHDATVQAQWSRGNTMSKVAFVRSWIENPQFASKKAEEAHKRKTGKVRTRGAGRPKSAKAVELERSVDSVLDMLEGVFKSGSKAIESTPAKPRKVFTAATLFGGKNKDA